MNTHPLRCFSTYLLLMTAIACSPAKNVSSAQPKSSVAAPMEEIDLTTSAKGKTDTLLENILKDHPGFFDTVLQNRAAWKVQIIYTQIDRQANNTPVFNAWYFNYDTAEYIYPASTVKLPVALLALQRLHELRLPGLDKNCSLITEGIDPGERPVYNDPSSSDGRPTVAQYIKKIFLVSDNDAFNRLYEFLGQQYINEQLHKRGYASAEIVHRLDVNLTPEQNRRTNPVKFFSPEGKLLYTQPMLVNETVYPTRNDFIGKSYLTGGQLVNQPMNFSKKNRLSLGDLTDQLRTVIFPTSVPEKRRFNLTPEDYQFVRQYMSQLPTEGKYLPYNADTANYWPAYGKFLLFGSQKGNLPRNIRIFNKVGDAYGCLSDVAYVVDFDKKIEFMLSARIYCNSDGTLNDDKYDYEAVGFPFMKHLGQVIYEYELKRARTYSPDLAEFRAFYDK